MNEHDQFAARRAIDLGLIVQFPDGQLGYLAAADIHLAGDDLLESERIVDYQRGRWQEVCSAARQVFAERGNPPVRFE